MISQFADLGDITWCPVVGWESYYWVSVRGDVWSLPRPKPHRGRPSKDGPLVHALDKDGYHEVCLHAGGRRQRAKVHILVARAFIGEPPEGKPLVLHRDDDKDNNHKHNLYYGDGSDNQRDAVLNGSNRNANKTHCYPGEHLLAGDNVYVDADGHRHCRACWKDRRNAG